MTFEKKIPTMSAISSDAKSEVNNNKVNNQRNDAGANKSSVNDGKGLEETISENGVENAKKIEEKILELQKQNAELERKLVYIASEYENSKRRNAKDLEDTRKFTISKFAEEIVNIFDILQKAVDTIDEKKTDKVLFDGVKMTITEFEKVFEKMQITKIEPEIGSLFDHGKQEAISRVSSELEVGAIVDVIRCGYELYGRLLRPAMVVVSGGK